MRFFWTCEKRRDLQRRIDTLDMRSKKARKYPFEDFAAYFGCSANTIRNEIHRGLCRMGSEEKGFYYVYDAAVAQEHADICRSRQGGKGLLVRKRGKREFAAAVKYLAALLLRKKTHKRKAGFYSVERCWAKTRRKFPEWSVCLQTVWNWIKRGELEERGITLDTVRLWKRRTRKRKHSADLEAWRIRNRGRTIEERPAEVEMLTRPMDLEGDLMESVAGDNSALLSIISRSTSRQWLEKISAKSQRAVHGALGRIVERMKKEGLEIETITFDNGICFRNARRLEEIASAGRKDGATRVFYAHPYASYQRARNERNHATIRLYTGQNLRNLSPKDVRGIEDFVNALPRKTYSYRTAAEEFARQLAGGAPPLPPPRKDEVMRMQIVQSLLALVQLLS